MYVLSEQQLLAYQGWLRESEKSAATIEKYLRDIHAFLAFLPENKTVTKESVLRYKQKISDSYKANSTNSMLVAINRFLEFMNWNDCKVKLLKIQRRCFRDKAKELTKTEYFRLLRAARSQKNERLFLLLQTICSTGIRVSEHQFITVEAVRSGSARVYNKGKERTICLPNKLRSLLLSYCKRQGLTNGSVFITRTGKPLNRCNIWAAMKALCKIANVNPQKVFPHNLRHLFAITYYRLEKDIVRLADILGHTSVETTRIYTFTSGLEHARTLSKLALLCPQKNT